MTDTTDNTAPVLTSVPNGIGRQGLGTATVIRGDARNIPLDDESVDLICTSPPYFALRSYQDGGEHYDGQIGAEPTPAEFVNSLLEVTRECMRVLKPGGSLWVNLGDKYSGYNNGSGKGRSLTDETRAEVRMRDLDGAANPDAYGAPAKSLIGIPWRYAIACIDELGLILRSEVIWSKCLSGGTHVYARVSGREKVMMVKDLARCRVGTVELWTGEKWSPMLRCDPTPPTEGRTASSAAARQARYKGRPVPALVADLEIEFRNGERVGCTPNHKWPTARGIVRADELTVGDVVPTVRLAPGTASPAGLDDEMTGWLVGLYIAEGSRSEDIVQIASHVNETTRFDRLGEIADAFDGTFALHRTRGNTATANLSGKVIRGILDTYVGGRTAKDKRLSPACWRRSDAFLRALLDGYLSGDGHYDVKNDRWRIGFTSNDGLATDLRAIAARLGYSLRLKRVKHRFDGRDYPGWRGSLLIDPARRKRPDGEIVAIRQSRARQFWNIEIADDPHEFALSSGILTENSNGMPESVTDRVRRSHEHWFHFTLNQSYFADMDPIREPCVGSASLSANSFYRTNGRADLVPGHTTTQHRTDRPNEAVGDRDLGRIPGSVWKISTEPLKVPKELGVDHFAAFPTSLPKRIIQGWCPEGGTVLDPFGGTGTTAMVAKALGRDGISLDMSADYCKIAEWRTNDRDQLAKVLGLGKAEQPALDQMSLFDGLLDDTAA